MRYSDVYIAGVANWLPELRPVSEAISDGRYDLEEQAANQYESVAVAGAGDAPPDMAARAARLALERSGVARPTWRCCTPTCDTKASTSGRWPRTSTTSTSP